MSDADERKAVTRSRYLRRTSDLTKTQSLALAYREMGYSASGVARKIDSTEGTVRNYVRRIAAQYGLEAVDTKLAEERTDLEEITPERLDQLSPAVRADWRDMALDHLEHVPEELQEEVLDG